MSILGILAASLGSNISTQHYIIPYGAADLGKKSVLSSIGLLFGYFSFQSLLKYLSSRSILVIPIRSCYKKSSSSQTSIARSDGPGKMVRIS